MTTHSKLGLLLGVLGRDPIEFYDRVLTVLEVKLEHKRAGPGRYDPLTEDSDFDLPQGKSSADIQPILREKSLEEVENEVRKKLDQLKGEGPFQLFHNGDNALARVCYAVCRVLKPVVVVETGVAYGVTSAFLLQALQVNQNGRLYSVDLPPLGRDGDSYVGALIPEDLKSRWQLSRGSTKRLMPKLLSRLGTIDLFVHDSLHTYRNMRREFEQVWPILKPGGAVIADDIEGNLAFQELRALPDVSASVVMKEQSKGSLFGVAVKRG